jgi:hypothetical protein
MTPSKQEQNTLRQLTLGLKFRHRYSQEEPKPSPAGERGLLFLECRIVTVNRPNTPNFWAYFSPYIASTFLASLTS